MYRYRIQQILKLQEVRNKIARDLHDDIGSTLGSIHLYSQIANAKLKGDKSDEIKSILEKIENSPVEIIDKTSDVVWAAKASNDTLKNLILRMEGYSASILGATGIQFNIEYDERITEMKLEMTERYSEKFDCLEGEVEVQLGKTVYALKPGESAAAGPNINHLFRNRSGKSCKFKVELRPASRGFEESLQIGYGLARDGECKPNGFPKNKLALAWLFDISESKLPGWMSLFEFILRKQAKKARMKGSDMQLKKKYVRF